MPNPPDNTAGTPAIGDHEARSSGTVAAAIAKLREAFPGRITEGERGASIDAQAILDLADDLIGGRANRSFGLQWPGKDQAQRLAFTPSAASLRPCPEESVAWNDSQNLFIEGDNLDALKLLREEYRARVKLIYIDPPYNTGGELVYPDDFACTLGQYKALTGQSDEPGDRPACNSDTSGRLHAAWLSMMLPRLRLARDFLREDGLIFISIDDNEAHHLRILCDEVFGPECFVNQIVVKSSETSGVKMAHTTSKLPKIKEYLLLYCRRPGAFELSPLTAPKPGAEGEKIDAYIKYYANFIENPDDEPEAWRIRPVREELRARGIEVTNESLREFKLREAHRVIYRTNNASLAKLSFDTATARVTSPTGREYVWWEGKQMLFLEDHLQESLCDLWADISTINLNKEMLGLRAFANGQKPLALIQRCLRLACTGPTDAEPYIVMDFFAGSGTTGHAVLRQCAEDGVARRFILVQQPDPLDPGRKQHQAAVEDCDAIGSGRTIAEITKERLRRAAATIEAQGSGAADCGFRVFKIEASTVPHRNGSSEDRQPPPRE